MESHLHLKTAPEMRGFAKYTLQNRWLLESVERNSNDNNGVG